jgi:hypothetical protein
MGHKRSTGWGVTSSEVALLAAIIGYGILVIVVTPLLLGFLPIVAIAWMIRVPVASAPAESATVEIYAAESQSPVATTTEPVASGPTTQISSAS